MSNQVFLSLQKLLCSWLKVESRVLFGLGLTTVILLCSVSGCSTPIPVRPRPADFAGAQIAFDSKELDNQVFSRVDWARNGDIALGAFNLPALLFPIYVTPLQENAMLPLTLHQQVINGSNPVLSPNGDLIAFYDDDLQNIRVLDRTQSKQTELVLEGNVAAWSPDGQQLAIMNAALSPPVKPITRTVTIQLYDLSGMLVDQVFELTDNGLRFVYMNWDMDWSPDGNQIAFTLDWPSPDTDLWQSDLYVLSLHNHQVLRLTNTPSIDEAFPSWSPDGNRLVFTSSSVHSNGTAQLTFINADSTCAKTAPGLFGVRDPSWSPDGTQIAVVSGGSVYVVDVSSLGEEFSEPFLVCP